MRRDADCRSDKYYVFDDVLPLERRHHERLPRLAGEEYQRAESRDHVDEKERYNDAL